MYESHFLLSQRPFTPAPAVDAYIPLGSTEEARLNLIRCIERSEGPGLIIGPAGTGKSLVCQLLAAHFRGKLQVAYLSGARLGTRRALLQNILFELKLPYRDLDEGELRLSLIDHLEPRAGGPEGLLLIIDEAHCLPLRLIEELRLLTNVVSHGQTRVRLVLAGGMALEERLSNPKLESFHQRIAARCYLQPLNREETLQYVQQQIRRCGGSADSLFTADAQASIHTASDGIPRLINQLCDHGLMLAALGGKRQLDAAGIDEAWADLQQLPLPLTDEPIGVGSGNGRASGIVEFGPLGDLPPAVAGTIGPDMASAAVANLESISQALHSLDDGTPQSGPAIITHDDFSPAALAGTEVELHFHAGHDPFGGHWEDEEVVIDRYASLEDAALRRQRVKSDAGRAIADAVTALTGANKPIESRWPDGDFPSDPNALVAAVIDDGFDPASDPLIPEAVISETVPAHKLPRRTAVSLQSMAQDDRDMIVVDAEPAQRAPAAASRPRRPEYRQLFSKLRSQ
jgi:type II secretory pathway predicted ATPase ExeA